MDWMDGLDGWMNEDGWMDWINGLDKWIGWMD